MSICVAKRSREHVVKLELKHKTYEIQFSQSPLNIPEREI